MNTKNKPKTTGASTTVLVSAKNNVFSINVVENDARIRLVTNAPPQTHESRREIRRVRAD